MPPTMRNKDTTPVSPKHPTDAPLQSTPTQKRPVTGASESNDTSAADHGGRKAVLNGDTTEQRFRQATELWLPTTHTLIDGHGNSKSIRDLEGFFAPSPDDVDSLLNTVTAGPNADVGSQQLLGGIERKRHSYHPDFKLTNTATRRNVYVEVKGQRNSGSAWEKVFKHFTPGRIAAVKRHLGVTRYPIVMILADKLSADRIKVLQNLGAGHPMLDNVHFWPDSTNAAQLQQILEHVNTTFLTGPPHPHQNW